MQYSRQRSMLDNRFCFNETCGIYTDSMEQS